ncbi:MAG: hypothetical protein KO464_01525 [Candidatus Methanofastidiosum sp.]|jgi:hypothetical protein|nr:hypothetical protein [Methanofastidiosum sp.]
MATVSCGEFVIEKREKFDSSVFKKTIANIKKFEENVEKIEEISPRIWKQKFNI